MSQDKSVSRPPPQPFHLAFPVVRLENARAFYGNLPGCPDERSPAESGDFDCHGRRIVAHLAPQAAGHRSLKQVDRKEVPARHCDVALSMDDRQARTGARR